jgi:hypothetical protein
MFMAPGQFKRTLWFAVLVGWFSQMALMQLVPTIGEVLGRVASLAFDSADNWTEHTQDATNVGWKIVGLLRFLGSVGAGIVAAVLTPRKPWIVATALAILSLLGGSFEQLPTPVSAKVIGTAILVPCLGMIVGVVGAWIVLHKRDSDQRHATG